ncbi:MAG: ParB N-terminal domain-containing protein [Nitrospinae bacterium]|nr:ParB N-terminal domain-containing protein [Nitrospinota bacterium]
MDTSSLEFRRVPVDRIEWDFRLTDFSLGPPPVSLARSIREIGITHPLVLVPRGGVFGVAAGHRRARLARASNYSEVPAWVLGAGTETATLLKINLAENASHREFSDVEKGTVLRRALEAGLSEERTVAEIMPLAGLERSKKLYVDFLKAGGLPDGLRSLLHDSNVPLRVFSVFFQWDPESLAAAEKLFSALRPGNASERTGQAQTAHDDAYSPSKPSQLGPAARWPGVNKWRELLELLHETARRDGLRPADLLRGREIQSVLESDGATAGEKYDRILHTVRQWRYPALSELKQRVLLALDRLKLDEKIRVRTSESFENGEIKIEIRFLTQKELVALAEQLAKASASGPMADLIKIFRELE